MLKTTQSKIILIICIIEVLLITCLGVYFAHIHEMQIYIAVAIAIAIVATIFIAILLAKSEKSIDIMTVELKDKLSNVSTQKNQIETILLHMTDGIIAFNRQGDIILINPAAKNLLSIRTRR